MKKNRPVTIRSRGFNLLDKALELLQRYAEAADAEREGTAAMVHACAGIHPSDRVVREAFHRQGVRFRKSKPRIVYSHPGRTAGMTSATRRKRRAKRAWTL